MAADGNLEGAESNDGDASEIGGEGPGRDSKEGRDSIGEADSIEGGDSIGGADSIRTALEAGEWAVVDGAEPVEKRGSEARGQRLYNRWSRRGWLYDAVMGMAAPIREEAFEALAAGEGETILDIGCGPGTNFERLREDVGAEGAIVGLDYSPEMVERAAERVAEEGWSNVHVVRADATRTCGPPATFDAAFTTFALHTMEDVEAVVENVHAALRPGGRFVVSDAREIQDWPASLLNPLYGRLIDRTVNHQPDQDPLGALESTFESVEVVNTYDAGSGYLAIACKAD